MSTRPYLSCAEIISFLAGYLDHELPPQTEAEFERHLAACVSCVAYLASYRETILAARAAARFDEGILDDSPADLIEAILRISS